MVPRGPSLCNHPLFPVVREECLEPSNPSNPRGIKPSIHRTRKPQQNPVLSNCMSAVDILQMVTELLCRTDADWLMHFLESDHLSQDLHILMLDPKVYDRNSYRSVFMWPARVWGSSTFSRAQCDCALVFMAFFHFSGKVLLTSCKVVQQRSRLNTMLKFPIAC